MNTLKPDYLLRGANDIEVYLLDLLGEQMTLVLGRSNDNGVEYPAVFAGHAADMLTAIMWWLEVESTDKPTTDYDSYGGSMLADNIAAEGCDEPLTLDAIRRYVAKAEGK